MLKLSTKQKKLIKALEKKTGVSFNGSTREELDVYINTHKEVMDNLDFREVRKPSSKQSEAIEHIEKVLQVSFTGSTMKEASDFIGEYLSTYLSKVRKEKS